MQPAEQIANKNKIRWWSHVERMAPTAPQQSTRDPASWKTAKGKATKLMGRRYTEIVQKDWDPDNRSQQLGEGWQDSSTKVK